MPWMLLACVPSGEDPKPPEPPATAHWVADTFADHPEIPIGKILLPGAFNSTSYTVDPDAGMSPDAPSVVIALWGEDGDTANEANRERIVGWAKTQGRSLHQQLEDGIRFLEINVTLKDGVITTWHSIYGVPLGDVLEEVVDFSLEWPDEVVVVSFGLSIDADAWPLFTDALLAPHQGVSFCDRLYSGPEEAALLPLGDLQESGRNLVWTISGDLRTYLESRGCVPANGTTDRTWSITDRTEGVEAALASSVDSRDPNHLLINDFAFSLDGAPSAIEQASYIAHYTGVQEASQVLGFAGDFPGRLIETYDANGNMNVLAGAYYQDTDLVEAAIAANRERWP